VEALHPADGRRQRPAARADRPRGARPPTRSSSPVTQSTARRERMMPAWASCTHRSWMACR
jgi:hypothetical protein